MRPVGILLFLSLFLANIQLSAQHPCEDLGITDTLGFITDINIPDDGILDPGDDFCIDFEVENFDLVIGFQFTLSFDPSIFKYTFNTMTPGVLLGPLSINDNRADNGAISVLWVNLNAEGQTLPDNSQIFTLCFQACGEPNDCSDLYFNEFFPFFPEQEVSHQVLDGEPCTFNQLLLDGASSTQIKIACDELNLVDLSVCNATNMTGGSLSFSACGGALPYTYTVTNSFNPLITFTGPISSDGEEISFTNLPAAVYTITIMDALGVTVVRNVNIENGIPLDFDAILRTPSCSNFENGTIVINNINGGTPGINGYTIEGSNGQFFANTYVDSLIRLSNGDYTVTVTDDLGCEAVESYTLLTQEIQAQIEIDSASCFDATDGFIRITPSGGVPFPGGEYLFVGRGMATSYESNSPFQDFYFSSLTETFNVTIRDANGCELILRIPIPTKSNIQAEFSNLTDVACKGDNTGSITIAVQNPGRYLFLLRDISGNFVTAPGVVVGNNTLIYNQTLPAGTYFLNIRESMLMCSMDTSFVINEPDEELILTSGSEQPDCNTENGLAFVSATGGVPPYSYEWSDNPGIDNDTLYNQLAGMYSVTVTDDVGCTMVETIEILQGDFLEIDIDILASLDCDGSGIGELEALIVNSNQTMFNYEWSNSGGTILGNNATLSFSDPDEYYLEVTDVNMNCIAFDTVVFDAGGIFTFEFDITNPSCVGVADGSIEVINLLGGVPPYSCVWDSPGFTDCLGASLLAGTYNVTISDSGGCMIDTFVVLTDSNADITFDVDIVDPSCVEAIDGSISFTNFAGGNAPYDCMWEDPTIIGCPRTGLSAGMYPVTIVDADGCQKDTVITLTDPEAIEIEVLQSDITAASCFGGTDGQAIVNITNNPSGASSYNFSWSNPADDDSGSLSDDATQLSPGLNFVYAFDNNSCSSDTFFFNIAEPAQISLDNSASAIMSPACKGECSGQVNLESNGGTSVTGMYNYIWEDGFNGANRTGLCAGQYFITIVDDNNCEHIDSFILTEPDTLILDIDLNGTVDLNCAGDNSGMIKVRATGGCGDYSYQWTGSNSTNDTAGNLGAGNYSVTVTDACGCTASNEYSLVTSTPILAQLAEPELPACFGATTCIGVESVSGGAGPVYTYSINFGDRLPIDSCVDVIAGMYNISVFDAVGCSETFPLMVNQPDPLVVTIDPAQLELNLGDSTSTLTANIESASPIDSIIWNSTGLYSCIVDNCQSININTSTFAVYEVTVYDENGCSASDEMEVTISATRNVYIPNAFNPSAFPPNDKFMILTGEGVVELSQFRIYDRWGNLVFLRENMDSPTSNDDGWDGRVNFRDVEQGVYVYYAEVLFVDNKVIKYKGDITLIR